MSNKYIIVTIDEEVLQKHKGRKIEEKILRRNTAVQANSL